MKPVFKKVAEAAPHCPICEVRLRGNNSYQLPWNCECGVWIYDPLVQEWDVVPPKHTE